MWWLFIVVGLFIVCLLIWIFTAVSSDDAKQQELEQMENVSMLPGTTNHKNTIKNISLIGFRSRFFYADIHNFFNFARICLVKQDESGGLKEGKRWNSK